MEEEITSIKKRSQRVREYQWREEQGKIEEILNSRLNLLFTQTSLKSSPQEKHAAAAAAAAHSSPDESEYLFQLK